MKLINAPINTCLIIKSVENNQLPLILHGICPGEHIQILSKFNTQPLRVKIRESFLAIDRKLAKTIEVDFK